MYSLLHPHTRFSACMMTKCNRWSTIERLRYMRHHLQFASEGRIILQAHGKTRELIAACMVRHSQFYPGLFPQEKHCSSGNYVQCIFLLQEIMVLLAVHTQHISSSCPLVPLLHAQCWSTGRTENITIRMV